MVTITINGRVAGDPEQKEFNGYRVTQFSVAARTNKKDAQGQYISNFYRCSCFGAVGDTIAKNFHKGDGIVITGSLSVREYVSTNGESRYSLDVEVRDFEFGIGRKQSGESTDGAAQNAAPAAPSRTRREAPTPVDVSDDDLPF